jgi:uncharacterized membrane-anchored protein YhcB (DUF1043 family)
MNKKQLKDMKETVRELESHAAHLVAALAKEDYIRADFHAHNASSCLKFLLEDANKERNRENLNEL